MDLKSYNYREGKGNKQRRKALKKAIMDANFDIVYEELEKLKQNKKEKWRKDRIKWDLSFLKKRSERYATKKFSDKNSYTNNIPEQNSRDSRNLSASS